jgi:hypothetical protein
MTWRPDRQCFTFKRQASPKESSFRLNVNRLPFFEEARSPHKRNFRFGRATFRSYGNIERPLSAQLRRPRVRSAMSASRRLQPSSDANSRNSLDGAASGSIAQAVACSVTIARDHSKRNLVFCRKM